ncbi:MAG: hypothetical protein KatS3mg105_0138 [Gemmatales bacterium]|nr:MAG: hypothetical protein KatS3mg105_0138 [Gemmatales bacterium]
MRLTLVLPSLLWFATGVSSAGKITPHLTVAGGPINGVLIEKASSRLAVYGWQVDDSPKPEWVLLTHGRRDALKQAQALIADGTKAIAPGRERYALEKASDFWAAFTRTRFHDYAQQSTKILAKPLKISRWVSDGDTFEWKGLTFKVLETPGYTRGSATYVVKLDGKTIAFTGDLIYGDGKILDLYSFQDEIPEADIRGYHGYGSRLAQLVASLKKVAAENPDFLIPARGPVITEPKQAIAKLIDRVQKLYRNYLSTNALHWYFKERRMRLCGERVLGKGANIELMPYCLHEKTPNWIFETATSRLLISDEGNSFLIDCGAKRVIQDVNDLIEKKIITKVDGIFVTHLHDDHTNVVQEASEKFKCPVYATEEYADVLANPGAYHLPALTTTPIRNITVMKDGQKMKWQEFQFTFHFFPGQSYYHGALFVQKKDATPIFFIGDSFAPSGFDDYCVLNRNLLHESTGYLLCLKKLRRIEGDYRLINEHIRYVFKFSDKELDNLEKRYRQRIALQRELFPWDDPNYGVDEQWAVFYPYGLRLKREHKAGLKIRLTNHSPVARTFSVTPNVHGGLVLVDAEKEITLQPRETGSLHVTVRAPGKSGNYLVTAGVYSNGMAFDDWIEALIEVE